MSTTLRIPTARSQSSRRVRLLAAASALVAAASVSVTLAVGNHGSDAASPAPSAAPASAPADGAMLRHHGIVVPRESGRIGGSSVERFHHFR
jgi:hypothetical protein